MVVITFSGSSCVEDQGTRFVGEVGSFRGIWGVKSGLFTTNDASIAIASDTR